MNSLETPVSSISSHQSPVTDHFQRLCEIVAKLRAPDGCPWDREQTNETLLPGLIEEAYEVAGAVRACDDPNLREELGDLILLAVMHAQIAEEGGRFNIREVLQDVAAKLIRRHPHVFGESGVRDTDGVMKQWEAIKREEKDDSDGHYLADLPAALPALMRAQKAQKKAARVNFDWTEIADVVAKVDEEVAEAKEAIASGDSSAIADEIGDLLFAVVNLARKSNLDAESVLHDATGKFVSRFGRVEDELRARGKKLGEVGLEELDEIWNAVKGGSGAME
ncbi:MAG TPA: nucleoside triphosphate pyrophosphohydrolase [Chthoniobacterales bacterium]|nr:nucleoside triphosphate pyrophosphohydrolase [Chthoniobacterales bacterium]